MNPDATWKTLEIALTNSTRISLGLHPVDAVYGAPSKAAKLELPSVSQLSAAIQFSRNECISNAFTKLSAGITDLIQHTNFDRLQRACIEKARSPEMLHKSNEVVPVIKGTKSFQKLCTMLSDTTYWNFLDIRMMEAMATASMIPAAKETIENFKETFFSMTLKEAAPYFPVIRVKPDHTELYEVLERDPSQMTIGELHEHRFYLETKLLKSGPDTCTICRIIIGSVEIIWQIHLDHAYQAYSRLKELDAQLLSQAIRMIVPAIGRWEGLPFLRQGQDMGEIGPIEPSGFVRHYPYSLPQGFEWSVLDSSNFDEVIQFYKYAHPSTYPITRNSLKWLILHPQYKKGCLMGVRLSSSKRLTGCVACIPCNIRVGGKLLSIVSIQRRLFEGFDKQQVCQLYSVGIKETMRRLRFEGIFQAMLHVDPYEHILEPIITHHMYTLPFFSLPYSSPRTVGLRKMKASDVPEALTLTNQYTSQFEIGQVFQSEEEFSHWFLSPLLNVTTYVVEDPNSGSITDMFSFETHTYGFLIEAYVHALVITKTSAEQLISDLLVCAKQQKVTSIGLIRFGLKEHLFKNFIVSTETHFLFYNYKHPQVGDDNFCLFRSGL